MKSDNPSLELELKREKLSKLTSNLINQIKCRRSLVREIGCNKKSLGLLDFDLEQEKKVFKALKEDLQELGHTERLAISLLIESQAGDSYPRWSQMEHLECLKFSDVRKVDELHLFQINPVMLLILDVMSFKMLPLNSKYRKVLMNNKKAVSASTFKKVGLGNSDESSSDACDSLLDVIAIDGPSGSGKSTITKEVALRLGINYIDTGAMFRSLALFLKDNDIKPGQLFSEKSGRQVEEKAKKLLDTMIFEYRPESDKDILIRINNVDYTSKIRKHDVSELTSEFSKASFIRDYLKSAQREISKNRPSILEGRDIGTVVFPNAKVKVFLTASPKIRAKRRFKQLLENNQGDEVTLEQLEKDIVKRDRDDSARKIAPLKKANDAILINTDNLSLEEAINRVIDLIRNKN